MRIRKDKTNVITILIFLAYLSLPLFNLWRFLGVPTQIPMFSDLALVTSNSQCHLESPNTPIPLLDCDPLGRKIAGLPEVWIRLFAFFKITSQHSFLIGIALIVLFIISISLVIRLVTTQGNHSKYFWLIMPMLFSPPIFLLLERGQTEIILFSLSTCALLLLSNGNFRVGLSIIFFTGILKIHFLLLFLFLVVIYRKRLVGLRSKVPFIILGVYSLYYIYLHAFYTYNSFLSNWASRSFGITVVPLALQDLQKGVLFPIQRMQDHRFLFFAIGIFIFLAVLLVVTLSSRLQNYAKEASDFVIESEVRTLYFLVFSTLIILSFFLISSWDYRMIYLIPLEILLIQFTQRATPLQNWRLLVIPTLMWFQQSYYLTLIGSFIFLFIFAILISIYFRVSLPLLRGVGPK